MARMNSVSLIGTIVGEPDIRYPRNGIPIYRCLLRVDRPPSRRTDDPEKKSDEINVIVWGAQAEAAYRHTRRGSLVAVHGWINSRRYTKKNTVSESERAQLEDLISSLGVGDDGDGSVDSVVDELLDILKLRGHETHHVAYEVSAPEIELLSDYVITEHDEELNPLIHTVRREVRPEELREFLRDLGILS